MASPTPPVLSDDIEYLDKRKLHLNKKLFAAVLIVFCVLAAGSHLVRRFQLARNADALKRKAEQAYEEKRLGAALNYLTQYLSFQSPATPDYEKAFLLFAEWSDERAATRKDRQKAFIRVEQALRQDLGPDPAPEDLKRRDDLRRRAIKLAVSLDRFGDALVHLDLLCPPEGEDRYDEELTLLRARAHAGRGGREDADQAAEWYIKTIHFDEDVPDHYIELVRLIDRYGLQMDLVPVQKEFGRLGESQNDKGSPEQRVRDTSSLILDAMIRNSHDSRRSRAYLTRAAYRRSHDQGEGVELALAAEDAKKAIDLADSPGEALLQAAEIELALAGHEQLATGPEALAREKKHQEQALEYARRGRTAANADLRFYLILSQLEKDADNFTEAERLLREGLQVLRAAGKNADPEFLQQRIEVERQFTWSLANLLIKRAFDEPEESEERLADAAQNIKALSKLGGRRELADFLYAQIDLGHNNLSAAARKLEEVRLKISDVPDVAHGADLALADCYTRMGNSDKKLLVFRRAMEQTPMWRAGRLKLAESLQETNNIDEAIAEYNRLPDRLEVWPPLVRLMIRKQLTLEIPKRNWDSVGRAIERAQSLAKQKGQESAMALEAVLLRAELLFQVAFERFHLEEDENGSSAADFGAGEELLAKAREAIPDEPAVWTALAVYILRRSDEDSTDRSVRATALLDDAVQKLGDRVEFRIVRARLAQQMERDAGDEVLAGLEADTDRFDRAELERLYATLAQAYANLGNYEKSVACWRRAAEASSHPLPYYVELSDVAARIPDAGAIDEALQAIRQIETGPDAQQLEDSPDGPNYLFARGNAALIEISKDPSRPKWTAEELERKLSRPRKDLDEVSKQRSGWFMVQRDLGLLAELGSRWVNASEHYKKARELGDTSPWTITQVIGTLLELNDVKAARQEVLRVENSSPELLTGELARKATDAARRANQLQEEEKFAKKLTPNSDDYRDWLWPLQIRIAKRDWTDDLKEDLKKLTDKFSDVPTVWLTRIQYLILIGNKAEAAEAIEQAEKLIPENPPALRPTVLGMCYQRLGEVQKAHDYYLLAVRAAPEDVPLGYFVVQFLLNNNRIPEADKEIDRLRKLPRLEEDDAEKLTEIKALIQANGGTRADFKKSLKTLGEGSENDLKKVSSRNLRARATILAASTQRGDRLRLIRILEVIVQRPESKTSDRLQLARLYEATENFPAAIKEYRKLKEADPGNPILLIEFALGTMNQKNPTLEELGEVGDAVDKLRQIEPNSFRTAVTSARFESATGQSKKAVRIINDFLGNLKQLGPDELVRDLLQQQKPAEALEALRNVFQQLEEGDSRALRERVKQLLTQDKQSEAIDLLTRFLVGADYLDTVHAEMNRQASTFLESIGEHDAAEETLRAYVKLSKRPEASLLLAAFLARHQRIDEALELCDAAAANCPPNAVGSVSVGAIRAGRPRPEQIKRVEERLLAALEKAQGGVAVQLSLSLADLLDFEERYTDATAIYKRLIEADDKNITALNNLAWLTSFLPGEQHASLNCIDRAIELKGPLPDLLDTRAVVLLNLGKSDEAIRDLETARGEAPNPSIYLHLALAHLKNKNKGQAAEWLAKAEQAGLDPKSLHALEKPGYEDLLKKLSHDNRSAAR